MRALALLALLAVPMAQASWMSDAEGDVRADADGTPASVPGMPAYSSMDLLGIDIAEDSEAFTFTLSYADLGAGAEDASPDGVACSLFFAHGERGFRAWYWYTPKLGTPYSHLDVRDGDAEWETHFEADLQTTVDTTADTVTLRLARGDLADASGSAPFPGRTLADVHATCQNYASSIDLAGDLAPRPPLAVRDDLPDLGSMTGAWPVQVGVPQTGHALLTSLAPYRASNGEATTFAYNVTAHNLAPTADEFLLEVKDVPSAVTVALAQQRITIPAEATVEVRVWVTVPFRHEHGSTTSFVLQATSLSDAGSVGRIDLGVRYLAVPQPAGHHDKLYVHSYPEGGASDAVTKQAPGIMGNNGYLNTLAEDEGDSKDGLAFSYGGATGETSWAIYLSPSLLVGLDTDLTRLGSLEAIFGSRTSMEGATVSGKVFLTGGPDLPTIAIMDPVAFTADGDVYVASGTLVPQPEADLVPYAKGHNLVLELTVRDLPADGPGLQPYLMPGTWLQLPLIDYHDSFEGMPETGAIVVAGDATQESAPAASKQSPVGPWAALAALAVALLVRRRK